MPEILQFIEKAIDYRQELFTKLEQEDTDAYRIFHGISEGFSRSYH